MWGKKCDDIISRKALFYSTVVCCVYMYTNTKPSKIHLSRIRAMFGGFETVISPAREREWFAPLSLAPSVP